MAGEEQDQDRNEPASAHKLKRAHERGSIFRSADLTFAAILFAAVACAYGLSASVVHGLGRLLGRGLTVAGRADFSAAAAIGYAGEMAVLAVSAVAAVAFVLWMAAFTVGAAQARGVFSAEPLTIDFSKLNPANGFKRLFSSKSLYDLIRNVSKLAVMSLAMWIWGRHSVPDFLHVAAVQPRLLTKQIIELVGSALMLLAGLTLLFAAIEWTLNRWDYLRRMRMSKRDVKDEVKEREGDPRIRARLRELRAQWLKRMQQLSRVRNADVLITNPTHYAVALEYRHGEMPAPLISARGAGEMARRMRMEAARAGVPVVQNAPLARSLFALKEGEKYVPEDQFNQVARILRWVYATRGQRRQAGTGARS